MYKEPLYISSPEGNNSFSFEKRKNERIIVPSIKSGSLQDLAIGTEIAFEDFDENGVLRSCPGLKHFLRTEIQGVPAVIFDNHNHAFCFWHEAREQGILENGATLVHIDQHTDMREPASFLSPEESQDLQKVFDYTNHVLNVGNFIIPAQKTGLINQIIQIRGETDLNSPINPITPINSILDLDLDIFAPELSYINFQKAKQVILNLARHASFITIATSPFFIDQKLAIQKIHELFL